MDLTLDLQQDGVVISYTDTATDEFGVIIFLPFPSPILLYPYPNHYPFM